MLLLLGAGAARAQTPALPVGEPETVHSEALYEKSDPTVRHFVEGYLQPEGSLEHQYSRWKKPVCPHVIGLAPMAAHQIEYRIREIATQVGAKVDRDDPCRPNIIIVFSQQPQAALNTIAHVRWEYVAEASLRLKMNYPIQSWYTEMVRDQCGKLIWDSGGGVATCVAGTKTNSASVLHTGFYPEFGFATTIVDANTVTGMPLSAVADYLALVTLSETRQRGACQKLPSIANLMVKDCPAKDHVQALSESDLAMLTGLYHAPSNRMEALQKQSIVREMKNVLRTAGPAP
jgi:hypothetical protein